jgi:homoserine kinase type II
MAVITAISFEEVRGLLAGYEMGEPASFEGLAAGSVNSNYALSVGGRRLFLRVYEEQGLAGARGEAAMLERLAGAGVRTPSPCRRSDGTLVATVRGKPAALFPWVDGGMRCQAAVTAHDARRVGEALARVHLAAAGESRGPGRFRFNDLIVRLDGIANDGGADFAPRVPALRAALEVAHADRDPGLPGGLVHGDLFRDNVLWDPGGEIAALLDFESAFDGTHAFDLAVTVLAWCVGDDIDPALARALCDGYQGTRPLTAGEREGLWAEACFAAMRFVITRITDYAMRAGTAGPRVIKDWRRFDMRHARLTSLGNGGFRSLLGL